MAKDTPKVSIIILNYNTYHLTIKEIESIEEVLKYDNMDVIIVDNCSTNDSVSQLNTVIRDSSKKYNYHLISNLYNGGYAAGNNVGLREALKNGADYCMVVNNDILFTDEDMIAKLVSFLEDNSNVGVVSPRIISKRGNPDKPIFYRKPTFWDLTFGIKKYNKERHLQEDELVYGIYAPRGSCMMIRSEAIVKIGFLDEGTFLYYEEPILAEGLLKFHYTVFHYGKTSVIHNHAETIKNNVSKKRSRKYVVQSLDLYLNKYRKFNFAERWACRMIRKYAYLYSHK